MSLTPDPGVWIWIRIPVPRKGTRMHVISTHFPSMKDFLAPIRASKEGTTWIQYSGNDFSLTPGAVPGVSLDQFLMQAQTLHGLEDTIATIEQLAQGLAPTTPAVPRVTRKPAWRSTGATVSVHRVLRGQVATAWRGTEPVPRSLFQKTVTVLLPCWFPWRMSEASIQWTMCTNMAYAMALQQAGVSVELVAFAPAEDVWAGQASVVTITLKALGDAWKSQQLALVAQPAFLRRGMFRFYDCMAPRYGHNRACGHLMAESDYPAALRAHTAWQGPQQTLLGAGPGAHIGSAASAQAWLRAHLTAPSAA